MKMNNFFKLLLPSKPNEKLPPVEISFRPLKNYNIEKTPNILIYDSTPKIISTI